MNLVYIWSKILKCRDGTKKNLYLGWLKIPFFYKGISKAKKNKKKWKNKSKSPIFLNLVYIWSKILKCRDGTKKNLYLGWLKIPFFYKGISKAKKNKKKWKNKSKSPIFLNLVYIWSKILKCRDGTKKNLYLGWLKIPFFYKGISKAKKNKKKWKNKSKSPIFLNLVYIWSKILKCRDGTKKNLYLGWLKIPFFYKGISKAKKKKKKWKNKSKSPIFLNLVYIWSKILKCRDGTKKNLYLGWLKIPFFYKGISKAKKKKKKMKK